MKVWVLEDRPHLSRHVQRRGLNAVARAANMDKGRLSRIVSGKQAVTFEVVSKILQACNEVKPNKKNWERYYEVSNLSKE